MRRLRSTVTAFSLLVLIAGPGTSLGATSPDPAAVASCPDYGKHLARAESALAGGKRDVALDALRDAAVALRVCEERTEEGADEIGSLLG